MPRGGHNRLPDEAKALKGTLKPSRTNPEAPAVKPVSNPRPPSAFTAEQRAAWKAVVKNAESLRCLGESDLLMLEAAAVAVAHLRAEYTAAEVNPKSLQAALKTVKDCLSALGLTPQSRGTVSRLAGAEVVDELDEFLAPPEVESLN